jgi:hypothetical protein
MPRIVDARYTVHAEYDFAADGGVQGDIAMRGQKVPQGVAIVDSLIKVLTAPTSGGAATIAIKTEGAADVQSAAAISGAPWSTLGSKRGTLDADTTPVTTTAERTPTITVATADLTAGKFVLVLTVVEYAA